LKLGLKLFELRFHFFRNFGNHLPSHTDISQKTQILDYAVAKTSEIAKLFMNFDLNENPYGDSRVVTREQADMAKIKLVCVDILLANAPLKKSEVDNMFELFERDGIYLKSPTSYNLLKTNVVCFI
jgi:hypothetical protein